MPPRKLFHNWARSREQRQRSKCCPGIGKSTAAAIAAFAFGERAAILDGNVKRVLARFFGIAGWPGEKAVEAALWQRANRLLPKKEIETYTQALMDLGATVCVRTPKCEACPVSRDCIARRKGKTSDIPAPRPRKALPQKAVTWLLLHDRGQLLLEKRAAPGIWGGLWSFPEAPAKDIDGHCRRSLGCEVLSTKTLETLEHGFTHFRLRIHPLLCQVTRKANVQSPRSLWIDVEDAFEAAVPAPVRTLVGRLNGIRRASR